MQSAIAKQSDPSLQVPPSYHWLLRLPPYVWAHMNLHLDYAEILNLSALSSEFYAEDVTKYLPRTVRHRAVARADAVVDPKTHCACYLCYRIKPVEDFQESGSMASYARVLQRNEYTGQRIFEVVSDPSPSQLQPPFFPSSPIGMAMSNPYYFSSPVGPSIQTAYSMAIGSGVGYGSSIGGLALAGPVSPTQLHRRWRPQAPGAEVGQIESLRTYCIQCALETHLAIAGDVIEPRSGPTLWVCACQVARSQQSGQRCETCGMSPVYRNSVTG